jgi:hypothetical protein
MDTNGSAKRVSEIADTTKEGIATAAETVTHLAGKGLATAVDAGGAIKPQWAKPQDKSATPLQQRIGRGCEPAGMLARRRPNNRFLRY